MTALFEICSKQDYSIAQFHVEKCYLNGWIDILLSVVNIDTPNGELSTLNFNLSEDKSFYSIRYLNDFDTCWYLLKLFKSEQNQPTIKTSIPFDECQTEEKDYELAGFSSQEEYEEYMAVSEFIDSDDFLSIGYSHVSYEQYVSAYE
ncbi:MAG: hypothetical protein V7K47_24810 [Nostoc sp.]